MTQVLEGTWEEVERQLRSLALPKERRVKVVVSEEVPSPPGATAGVHKPGIMRRGMFPELRGLTDEDLKSAEFHGDPDDGLDWS
jgi:hypothetical protein